MMRVLVAIDGSPSGEVALDLACSLLAGRPVAITVFYVVPRHQIRTKCGPMVLEVLDPDAERATAAALVEAGAQRLRGQGLGPSVEGRVDLGDPSERILSTAERMRAELLILGYRGLTRLQRVLFGSVSTKVVTNACCPVLVAHLRKDAATGGQPSQEQVTA